MKNYLLICGIATILTLSACGNNIEADTDSNDEPINMMGGDEPETIESGEKGSRSNPFEMGESAQFDVDLSDDWSGSTMGTVELTVDNVIRGQEAIDYLNSGYSTVDSLDDEENEWVVFDFKYEYIESDDPDISQYVDDDFSIYNTDGAEVRQDGFVFVLDEDEFVNGDLYSGGTLEGKIVLQAPSDQDFMIVYNGFVNTPLFFEVKN